MSILQKIRKILRQITCDPHCYVETNIANADPLIKSLHKYECLDCGVEYTIKVDVI